MATTLEDVSGAATFQPHLGYNADDCSMRLSARDQQTMFYRSSAHMDYLSQGSTSVSYRPLFPAQLLDTVAGHFDGPKSRKASVFANHRFVCANPRNGYRCKVSGCVNCLIVEARRRAWAIQLSVPTHAATLTGIGTNHRTATQSIRRLRRLLDAKYGSPVKVCGSIETTPSGHGHAHLFLHVDGPLDALKLDLDFMAAADRAGLGDCRIDRIGGDRWHEWDYRHIDPGEIAGEEYEFLLAASYYAYPTKTLADDDLRDRFLELNRQGPNLHLGFQSHGFFRDGPAGEHLTEPAAKRRAYKRAQERWRKGNG